MFLSRCGVILEMGLCVHAMKDTYPDLVIDSLTSSSITYCIWEDENERCVSKNKGGLKCEELVVDLCERFVECAIVGGVNCLVLLIYSFFFKGICIDHPCSDSFVVGENGICPFGCVFNEGFTNQSNPSCVLEVCGRYSDTDCLNHTENNCTLTKNGCRLV
jgi:hypothetical protein